MKDNVELFYTAGTYLTLAYDENHRILGVAVYDNPDNAYRVAQFTVDTLTKMLDEEANPSVDALLNKVAEFSSALEPNNDLPAAK